MLESYATAKRTTLLEFNIMQPSKVYNYYICYAPKLNRKPSPITVWCVRLLSNAAAARFNCNIIELGCEKELTTFYFLSILQIWFRMDKMKGKFLKKKKMRS